MLRYICFLILININCFANDIQFVTVTTYNSVTAQCDATPLITASGHRIKNPNKREMIIAISRDLRKIYKFGTKVRIIGAGRLDGIYTIEDVMNSRFKNRIDILLPPKYRNTKLSGIRMSRVVNCEYCGTDKNDVCHFDTCFNHLTELVASFNKKHIISDTLSFLAKITNINVDVGYHTKLSKNYFTKYQLHEISINKNNYILLKLNNITRNQPVLYIVNSHYTFYENKINNFKLYYKWKI